MARGEVLACCFLSELWSAEPTAASHWGIEWTGTGRCLDSGCGQWEMEKGEKKVYKAPCHGWFTHGLVRGLVLW